MNDIRTLTLRFADKFTTERFVSLAKRKGYEASVSIDDSPVSQWIKVTVAFQNKAERSKFLAAWARDTMTIIGA